MSASLKAVLFDKDGTLFQFEATWGAWVSAVVRDLARGDEALQQTLALSVGFELATAQFEADSLVIAGTGDEVMATWASRLDGVPLTEIEMVCARHEAALPLLPCCDLAVMTSQLRVQGLSLGIATNDYHRIAVAHLAAAGVSEAFDCVMGCDSGFGAKPDPGMLLAFCDQLDIAPSEAAMVGDSTRDLLAARHAGFGAAVGVLTGPAESAELSPLADVVLESVEQLPAWLANRAIRSQ